MQIDIPDLMMTNEQISEAKFSRLTAALSVCEEFSLNVRLVSNGRIVVFIHEKWAPELEMRLNQIAWRFIDVRDWGCFKIVSVVDRYR